ncbi:ATPase WRNIP1-like [Babylonia areolata]|uniref:ATPase WRNIP1-like n=1 Tax=Babylonia areolata TaxID=304850 RepID=UPI003FD1C59E
MECPVCGRVFPASSINTHVNECLNNQVVESNTGEEDTGGTFDANERKGTNTSTKRKSSTTWGSLQPMRPAVSPNSSKKPKIKETTETESEPRTVNIDREEKHETSDDVSVERNVSYSPARSTHGAASSTKSTPLFPGKSTQSDRQQPAKSVSTNKAESFAPLAERMRPKGLEDYVGQDKAVGRDSMLYSLLSSDHIPSLILWGPPGCGKTTLARIVANNCRARGNAKFLSLSAAVCGVNEVKETIKIARNDQRMFRKKTVMFLDEIHRFNKTQQDVLLPHVEDGTITLIGATTENPSFQVNSALLSRCRVIVLEKLSAESILSILRRALPHIGAVVVDTETDTLEGDDSCDRSEVSVNKEALELLSNLVDGDARAALNGLQMAVEAKGAHSQSNSRGHGTDASASPPQSRVVTVDDIKEGLQRSHVLYDRAGEEHYNIISALHKSMRGSDTSASLYWLARMLEGGENPLYIARRLIRFASEDVGLADPQALPQAVAAYQGCHLIGMPECEVLLAQCAVYLARAPKSVEIYKAYGKAKACVRDHKGPLPSVPLHLRNAPTRLMKNLGYSKGYKYNPDYAGPVDQTYFPDELLGTDFFS